MYTPTFSDAELDDVAAGTRLRIPVPFFLALEVEVRPLNETELEEAHAEARSRVRMRLAQRGIGEESMELAANLAERAIERSMVVRATMQPGARGHVGAPFFGSLADVEELDGSTCSALFDAFSGAQRRISPARDESDAKALAKALSSERSTLDTVRTKYATQLCAYYGAASACDLTSWQVIKFARLMEDQVR
jgi:hypothetical protein